VIIDNWHTLAPPLELYRLQGRDVHIVGRHLDVLVDGQGQPVVDDEQSFESRWVGAATLMLAIADDGTGPNAGNGNGEYDIANFVHGKLLVGLAEDRLIATFFGAQTMAGPVDPVQHNNVLVTTWSYDDIDCVSIERSSQHPNSKARLVTVTNVGTVTSLFLEVLFPCKPGWWTTKVFEKSGFESFARALVLAGADHRLRRLPVCDERTRLERVRLGHWDREDKEETAWLVDPES
jgi:hypothetical protein